jgi:hypothetical protein
MELLDTTFFLTHENFRAELCCVFVSEKKIVLSLQFGLLLRPVRLLISHVLFSQNKSATSNQSAVLFSQNKSVQAISHQPNEQDQSEAQPLLNGKSPSDVPYLLSKSDFGPSSQNRVFEVPQLSNPFIFCSLAVSEGGFHMI